MTIMPMATYDYHANGNRIKYVTDNEDLEYSYDAEDRLLSDGKDTFSYDAFGRKVSKEEAY